VDSENSICPKSGALITAGRRRLPSSSHWLGSTVVGVTRGSKGIRSSTPALGSLLAPCRDRVMEIEAEVAFRLQSSSIAGAGVKRYVVVSGFESTEPSVRSSPDLPCPSERDRRRIAVPVRNKLVAAREPSSVSQLRKTTWGRCLSISIRNTASPAPNAEPAASPIRASPASRPVAPGFFFATVCTWSSITSVAAMPHRARPVKRIAMLNLLVICCWNTNSIRDVSPSLHTPSPDSAGRQLPAEWRITGQWRPSPAKTISPGRRSRPCRG